MKLIAQLIKKNDHYICSECRMTQPFINNKCNFCDTPFSNYEDVILDIYNTITEYEIKEFK